MITGLGRLIGLVSLATLFSAPAVAVTIDVRQVPHQEETALERDEPDRLLALVGKDRPIEPLEYAPPDLVPLDDGPYELRAEAAEAMAAMAAEAGQDGITLDVISAYRSYDTQAGTYQDWVNRVGAEAAELRSARPGHSEHQLGLAVDLDDARGCYLRACFGEGEAGQWLTGNAHRFGFVLSYPEWAFDRTGFRYEPWHYRYVGPRAASQMDEFRIALLEDFLSAHGRGAGVGAGLGLS